jgi:hypothetical protein
MKYIVNLPEGISFALTVIPTEQGGVRRVSLAGTVKVPTPDGKEVEVPGATQADLDILFKMGHPFVKQSSDTQKEQQK